MCSRMHDSHHSPPHAKTSDQSVPRSTGLEEIGPAADLDIETRITAQREVADLLVEQVRGGCD
jgi:hypothetical protein